MPELLSVVPWGMFKIMALKQRYMSTLSTKYKIVCTHIKNWQYWNVMWSVGKYLLFKNNETINIFCLNLSRILVCRSLFNL